MSETQSSGAFRTILSDDFSNGYDHANWGAPFHGGVYWNGAWSWNAGDVNVRDGEMQVTMTRQGDGWWTGGGFNSFKAGKAIHYGTVSFDAKVEEAQGTMAAILMWPASDDHWPPEIDILETPAQDVMHTLHWQGPNGNNHDYYDATRNQSYDPSSWHHYDVTWLPDRLTIQVDGRTVAEWNENIPDEPMGFGAMGYVGGAADKWMGGAPDGSTPDQVTVHIDNVVMSQWTGEDPGTGSGSGDESPRPQEPATPPDSGRAPASLEVGTGPDALVLHVSQDFYQGDAQYVVRVNGEQVGEVFTVSALRDADQYDTLTLRGDWGSGTHTVTVEYLNDLWEGTPETDRNLYVTRADYNGVVSEALGSGWTGGTFTVGKAGSDDAEGDGDGDTDGGDTDDGDRSGEGDPTPEGMPPLLHHEPGDIYFTDADGKAVYLAGSHSWVNLTDQAGAFDYGAYLDLLEQSGANLTRLWAHETAATDEGPDTRSPLPWVRLDDGRYDLTRFNQDYFDRLHDRVEEAGKHGIYVDVMLFNGWSGEYADWLSYDPWQGNVWKAGNNVNGIDGDPTGRGDGYTVHTLSDPQILDLQKAYIREVMDTLDDLPNVLYEVGNEMHNDAETWAWQNHILDYMRQYDASQGLEHPVGMTASVPRGDEWQINRELEASNADWISPHGWLEYHDNPPAASGDKVSIVDSDHTFGIGGGVDWVWQQFMRGHNLLSMEGLEGTGIAGRNIHNDGHQAEEEGNRMGILGTRKVAEMLDLGDVRPDGDLASTGFALADAESAQYLVYAPSGGGFSVDLSAAAGDRMEVHWLDVDTAEMTDGGTVTGGDEQQWFTAPFHGAALVLTPEGAIA